MNKMQRLALVMTSLLVILSFAGSAEANPHPEPGFPEINASYFIDSEAKTVTLNISISMLQDTDPCLRQAWYSLDGQNKISIPLTYEGTSYWGIYHFSEVTGETKLPLWSDGPHILTVTAGYYYGLMYREGSTTLYIGQPEPTPTPLIFKILSPQNNVTYSSNEVPVTYSINSNVWYAYFALDKSDSTTDGWGRLNGNVTLTKLSEGSHKLNIFVKPEDSSQSVGFAEKTVYFTVDTSNTQTTPTPTVPEYPIAILPLLITAFLVAIIKANKKQKLAS
jgi:hypothetical protein